MTERAFYRGTFAEQRKLRQQIILQKWVNMAILIVMAALAWGHYLQVIYQ